MMPKILMLIGGLVVAGLLTFAVIYLNNNLTLRRPDEKEERE